VTLAFSDCQLNAESRELSRAGDVVSIQPKTLDLLIYLINNRERAIGKDELQNEVWGTIVSDAALTRAVMKLRRAVGDDSKGDIVKTVPRYGYRFVAHIKYGSTPASIGPPERKSIAVLPLQNMSGDVENEYFSDGIAEEILNLLAKLPSLRVASRTSSFTFRNSDKIAKDIAKALDVDILLEGSVRRAGDRVRITMQLIDAEDDAHIWSEIYNRELTDIFDVQADIAREVVSAITRGEAGDIATYQATKSPKAYDYYLRGYKKFHELDRGSIRQVREMFRKAIEVDPSFAKAWAGLANASCLLHMWWEASQEILDEAHEASQRALELGADLAESHTARGFTLSLLNDFDGAVKEFEQAIKLDPLLYDAWYLYGRACYAAGCMEKAAELFIKAGDVRPDDYQALSLAASAYLKVPDKERSDECAREQIRRSERHLAINPGDTRAWGLGACNIGELGDTQRGEEWLNKMLGLASDDVGSLHLAACFYGARGDVEKTIHFLERRFKIGDAYIAWMDNDTDFDCVRDDPRYKAMIERQRRGEERPSP
jgi:adenylate cyclase